MWIKIAGSIKLGCFVCVFRVELGGRNGKLRKIREFK